MEKCQREEGLEEHFKKHKQIGTTWELVQNRPNHWNHMPQSLSINSFYGCLHVCKSLAGLYAYYANCAGLHKFEIRKATSPTCDRMAVSVYNFDERMKQNDPSGIEKTARKNNTWQPGLQFYVGRSNSPQACIYLKQ